MDNPEDKTRGNGESAGAGKQPPPDPRVEPKEDFSKAHEKAQPAEVIRRSDKELEATLHPHESMQMGQPMQFGPSVKDILVSVFRFKWTFLLIFILLAAPLIAAIWGSYVPAYRAGAEVRVRPIIPYLVFETEESGKIPLYDLFVKTQVRIIKSVEILQRVLDQPQIRQTGWYKNPPESFLQRFHEAPVPPIERLKESLTASTQKDTEIIEVTFTARSTEDAKLILDTVLDKYILYIDEMSDATQDKVYSRLVDKHKSLENEILGREKFIDGLKASLGTATPQELISQKRVRLDEMQARLDEVQQNIDLLKWELNKFSSYDSNDPNLAIAGDMDNRPQYYEDKQWRDLYATLSGIQLQIESSPRRPEHPDTKRLEREAEFTQELLKKREAQLDEQWQTRSLIARAPVSMPNIAGAERLSYAEAAKYLEHQLQRAEHEEKLLLADIEKQQTEFDELFKSAQLLEKQNTALLHRREVFEAVRQRLDQKTVERNAPGSIEILTRASVGPKPANDRRIAFSVMVVVLALGAGGGVAFWRANKNETVYSAQDMPYPMQVPLLGHVVADGSRSIKKRLTSQHEEMQPVESGVIESMRVVRTALLSRLNGCDSTAVLVTSAIAGTGKSYFTIMLGQSLAMAGKKVIVIDADLRKMTLTKRLDLAGKPGFIQSLRRKTVLKRHIFQSVVKGLSFLPAGEQSENGMVYEEIANGVFKSCIDKLRRQ
jgi:uncharacterized protein involved in exopolysaccharide biosynthesis